MPLVLLLLHAVASADIIVGYIPSQGEKVTSTAWYAWFAGKVQPKFSEKIRYHEVENVESLNELMNTFSMVDFAVLSKSQLKEFHYLSGFIGPVKVGGDSELIARMGVDENVLNDMERFLAEIFEREIKPPSLQNAAKSSLPQKKHDTTSFVKGLYLQFLQREPDNKGLSYWVGMIEHGTMTREQVADSIRSSAEVRAKK